MDTQVERWINAPAGHHPGIDAFMRDAASWGEWVFVAIVVTWFVFAWTRGRASDRRGAILALAGAGVALGINQILSRIWDRPRPFVADPARVHVLIAFARDSSFPSDHAAAGFAIALALFLIHRRLGTLTLIAAGVMSYARVYVGLHYPSDVLVGALIGLAATGALVLWAQGPLAWIQHQLDRLAAAVHLPFPVADQHARSLEPQDPA